jgi:hypothetical protein
MILVQLFRGNTTPAQAGFFRLLKINLSRCYLPFYFVGMTVSEFVTRLMGCIGFAPEREVLTLNEFKEF